MDGQVGYLQQRSADVQQAADGMERIVATDDDAAGKTQRAVHPRAQDGAAVGFGVELDDATVAGHFGVGLDAEGGRVAVCGDDVCPGVGKGLRAEFEGKDGRVVLSHIKAVARLEGGHGVGRIDFFVTRCVESATDGVDGQEVDGRGVEKVDESGNHAVGRIGFVVVSMGFSEGKYSKKPP